MNFTVLYVSTWLVQMWLCLPPTVECCQVRQNSATFTITTRKKTKKKKTKEKHRSTCEKQQERVSGSHTFQVYDFNLNFISN